MISKISSTFTIFGETYKADTKYVINEPITEVSPITDKIKYIKEYIKDCEHNLTCGYNPKVMKQEMELIKNDLEILEALKRNVGIRIAIQEWANKEAKVFPNDRKIVKEWLEK